MVALSETRTPMADISGRAVRAWRAWRAGEAAAERSATGWLMRRQGWVPLGFVHPETLRAGSAPVHDNCKRPDRIVVMGRHENRI